jgi:hypothetical protein
LSTYLRAEVTDIPESRNGFDVVNVKNGTCPSYIPKEPDQFGGVHPEAMDHVEVSVSHHRSEHAQCGVRGSHWSWEGPYSIEKNPHLW